MSDRLTQAQQRLQELSKDYQPLVSAQSVREQRAEIRARADACDLGAQCAALVQRLAAMDPHQGRYHCVFCKLNIILRHANTCLWQQARQLTKSEAMTHEC